MEQKVCLDTDVCIEIIKNNEVVANKLSLNLNLMVYLSSISVFELFLRESNLNEIENFIRDTYILDFNDMVAKKASDIFKDLRKRGLIIDHRDIFIAATCIVNNCSLITLNYKHFNNIKGLKLLKV